MARFLGAEGREGFGHHLKADPFDLKMVFEQLGVLVLMAKNLKLRQGLKT